MKNNVIFYGLLFLVIIVQTSCKTTKDIEMFQDLKDIAYLQNPLFNKPAQYIIKPLDNLYIDISTLDPEVNKLFRTKAGESGPVNSDMFGAGVGQYLNGYRVAVDSMVNIPLLGEVKLAGLTRVEAEATIKKKAEEYVNEPTVDVKLLNSRVNMLGEVSNPGLFYMYEGSLNIFEAIGTAGGITKFADLKNVIVNRQINNSTTSFKVDVTNSKIYNSEVFYLQPNDLVYVPPTKLAMRSENLSTYTIFLSTITTALFIVSLFGFYN